MSKTGFEEVAEVLPERDTGGGYFWQPFAERLQKRLDGLPAPEGNGLFVDECLRAGANAVPVVRRNRLWRQGAPDISEKRARGVYEMRIRLGLFYAASVRFLFQGMSRLRVKSGETEWKAVSEEGESFRDFAARQEGEVEVTWTNSAPSFGKGCVLTQAFLTYDEMLLLTPELAEEVYEHAGPEGPAGLFGMMLAADGQAERLGVDVAGVFLEGLAECVDQQIVRVNTRANGHVFITPEFWLLTTPIGLGYVRDHLRTRKDMGRRYDFSREEIYRALLAEGHLVSQTVASFAGATRRGCVRLTLLVGTGRLSLYGVADSVSGVAGAAKGGAVVRGYGHFEEGDSRWKRRGIAAVDSAGRWTGKWRDTRAAVSCSCSGGRETWSVGC